MSTQLSSRQLYPVSQSQLTLLSWCQHSCHQGSCTQLVTTYFAILVSAHQSSRELYPASQSQHTLHYAGVKTPVITGVVASQLVTTYSVILCQNTCHHGSCTQFVGHNLLSAILVSKHLSSWELYPVSHNLFSAILVLTNLSSREL